MYDRHKPIIKWYEYDASKLIKNYSDTEENTVEEPNNQVVSEMAVAEESSSGSAGNDDFNLDDEVARIMAAFTNAKQDGVDSCFANMAAE